MTKYCNGCGTVKDKCEFYVRKASSNGLSNRCKDCTKKYANSRYETNKSEILDRRHRYVKNNPDKIKEQRKRHYSKNKDYILSRNNQYYRENKSQIIEKNTSYGRARYHSDEVYRLSKTIAGQLRSALVGRAEYTVKSRMYRIVGLKCKELVSHLYGTFKSRYGIDISEVSISDVEIDHIIPKSTATSVEELEKLNHYTNLQLLMKPDNAKKRNSLVNNQELE